MLDLHDIVVLLLLTFYNAKLCDKAISYQKHYGAMKVKSIIRSGQDAEETIWLGCHEGAHSSLEEENQSTYSSWQANSGW